LMTPFSMSLAPDLSTQRRRRMQRQLRSLEKKITMLQFHSLHQ